MTTPDELFQKMTHAKYFTTLDLSKGFWQVSMNEEDIKKTAFVTPDGLYEFLKMPFGLVNSSATLVKGLRDLFGDANNVSFYVDDIIVYNDTFEEHMKTLEKVLCIIKKANIKLRPTKCHFIKEEIEFIGHKILGGYLIPNTDNDEKIRNAPRPKTKKEVQAFLGLSGFYRKYIPNYATLATPLTNLIRKGKPNKVNWTSTEEESFNSLKNALSSKPVLKIPDFNKRFILRTDASNTLVSVVNFYRNIMEFCYL